MASFPWKWLMGFVILVALSFTLFQVADLGPSQAGVEPENTANETLLVTYDRDVHVSRAPQFDRYTQGFGDGETLVNQSGTELVEGTDYEWNTTDGGVTFINTSNTSDGEEVNISYGYKYNVEEVREGEPILRSIVEAIPLWVLVPAGLFFAGVLLWLVATVKGALSTGRQIGSGRR